MSSLSNALKLLSSFSAEAPRQGVTELANAFGLPKSTVSRTMKELGAAGFVERPSGRLYQIGSELFRIGSLYRTAEMPLDRIDGHLRRLVARFPASGYIAINRGLDCIILRMREGSANVRFVIPEGTILPAYTVAVGKALLSRYNEERLRELVPARLTCKTPHYSATRQEFLEELAAARDRGWADLNDMASRGIDAIGISVRMSDEETIGIALSFMSATTTAAGRAEMVRCMLELGRELGAVFRDDYWLGL